MHTPTQISTTQLLAQLEWRYATKKFDPTRKIPATVWEAVEQSLVLTPSSFGLQPWKFVVITNPKLKELLVPHTFGQRQIAEASHVVVFAARTSVTLTDIDAYIQRIATVRQVGIETLAEYRQRLISTLLEGPRSKSVTEWTAQQAHIALGAFLASAALLGIDACPIGGFNPDEYDRALNLSSQGFRSTVIAAAGYRHLEDKYASLPKVRFPANEVIQHFS